VTTVAISQPIYFPWAGFFEQMALADIFVWLDDAQFSKGSYTNRIQVKLANGRKWMTIPLSGGGTDTPIGELVAAGTTWKSSHRSMLQQSLASYEYIETTLRQFDEVTQSDLLCDLLIQSTEVPAQLLKCLPKTIVRSSAMNVKSRSSERVLEIVKKLGGHKYITGHGAAQYLDHEAFEAEGIEVEYMDYSPEPWTQGHGAFTPFVTVLDLIASTGNNASAHLRPRTVPWSTFLQTTG
jgi:hypothetical protein